MYSVTYRSFAAVPILSSKLTPVPKHGFYPDAWQIQLASTPRLAQGGELSLGHYPLSTLQLFPLLTGMAHFVV